MSGRAALYTTEAVTDPMAGSRSYEIHRTAFVSADRENQAPIVHPDAELLRLGAELDAVWKKEQAAWDIVKRDDLEDDDPTFVLARQLQDVSGPIVSQIGHLTATTLDGLCVKARAVSWCHCGDEIHLGDVPASSIDVRLAQSIINELLAMSGRAVPTSEPTRDEITQEEEETMKAATIQDALGNAHDLASILYALKAVRGEEDSETPRDAACDLLIEKAHQLAAELPGIIDEAHHVALFGEQSSKVNVGLRNVQEAA